MIIRLIITISTADAGITSSALRSCSASPPAMPPIVLELTARPIQPQVMAKPIAVPVTAGNISPTTASVVGKTGAIEMPAMATNARATPGFLVRSMKKVVIAMATEANNSTAVAGT